MDIIRKKLNNDKLENIYFIVGFGDFSYSGYDEYDFYKVLIKNSYLLEEEIQQLVNVTIMPATDNLNILLKTIKKSNDTYKSLKVLSEETKIQKGR